MKAALAINYVEADCDMNLDGIVDLIEQAAAEEVELIVFPEMAVTGFVTNDVPSHDFSIATTIPGPITNRLSILAKKYAIWIAIGLLEKSCDVLYDSAILIDANGEISLKYRRVHPNWHGRNADSRVYKQGHLFPKVLTPFGTVMFLICGDLWDDTIVQRVNEEKPDLLLYPFARTFGGAWDQQKWDHEELDDYAARIKMVGCTALMVNYLSDENQGWEKGNFGGAWLINRDGQVIQSHPLGKRGLLLVKLPGSK
ncbi:carbon-nitrogen hydrolase family protein [Alicyclobacillus fastidiosus]|uniref:carbon-nitrogen hydrolase family protein n=1 Tax=Alicyclobacillus fastidiosus TaxID=392011 RepID=UPI0023E9F72F|nr:carbon-nitrogen hydrolase family protein [Alicyclobacillus fastidiosus]GMA66006.1 carbon-nitrogen hydrolase [Alicyclobacillus fastidiosus]